MANIVEIIINATDNASSVVDSTFQNIQGAGQLALGAMAAVGAGAIAAGAGVMSLARSGAGLQDVQTAFSALAQEAGTSSQSMLYSLQQASGGMVDQQTLMLEYNNASTVMGSSLAQRIPEAMQYLDRISDATGRSVTGMMDSLIGSVGRLRPQMLAQMGITVDATTAYDTYAASIGKTGDQLTQSEQQTALFNAAVASLQTTAEALPDVANSAGDSFAVMDTNIANLGQNISTLFIPAGQRMADGIARISGIANTFVQSVGTNGMSGALHEFFTVTDGAAGTESALSGIFEAMGMGSDAANALAIPLNVVGNALVTMFDAIGAGAPLVTSLTAFFSDLGAASIIPPEAVAMINALITGVSNLISPIIQWVQNNVQLNDVLTAFGIAVSTVIIPAVIALAAPFLPIIATFGALVLGITLLRQAWESDFGGIQTFVTTQVLPGLQTFFSWLGNVWTTQVQPGLSQLADWFTTTALPAAVGFVQTVVIPGVQNFVTLLGNIWTTVGPVLGQLADWFITSALPQIHAFITGPVTNAINGFVTLLTGIWSIVGPPLGHLYDFFVGQLGTVNTNIIQPLTSAFSGILDIGGQVMNFISGATTSVGNFLSGIGNAINGGGSTPPSRDVGGFGVAGQPYLIGAGAQPEMFVPNADGRFIPNVNSQPTNGNSGGGDGGITIHGLKINANSHAEGQAAADGFNERMAEERRRRG